MKEHDVARSYFFGAGDIYNLRRPSHLKRVLVNDRDSFGKSDDFRIAFGDGLVARDTGAVRRQFEENSARVPDVDGVEVVAVPRLGG